MKKLFTEPEVEILKFLCDEGNAASPDIGPVGGGGSGTPGDDDIFS